ncbi:MAG: hypothetical protein QM503_03765 [Bacteroidota bacterium]
MGLIVLFKILRLVYNCTQIAILHNNQLIKEENMKKIITMIFMLSLLIAAPFAQADNSSPPVAIEHSIMLDVDSQANTQPVFAIPAYELYSRNAMDAAREDTQRSLFLSDGNECDYCSLAPRETNGDHTHLKEFLGPGDKQGHPNLC